MKPHISLRGLTLIEVLVVIGIIGILAVIISINALESNQISRDYKRQADLRALQSAVELYKNKYGRYPAGCKGAGNWSGQVGTDYECDDGSTQYIQGLAPEFISVLPREDRLSGDDSGYVYVTNSDQSVYKIMAMRTVESDVIGYDHEFKSCHIIPRSNGGRPVNDPDEEGVNRGGWCNNAVLSIQGGSDNNSGTINHCIKSVDNGGLSNRFDISYGVWGGFAELVPGLTYALQIKETTKTICK